MKKSSGFFSILRSIFFLFLTIAAVGFCINPTVEAATITSSSNGPGPLPPGQLANGGKDHRTQDSVWLGLKLAHEVNRQGVAPVPYTSSAYALNYNPAQSVFEPHILAQMPQGIPILMNICGTCVALVLQQPH